MVVEVVEVVLMLVQAEQLAQTTVPTFFMEMVAEVVTDQIKVAFTAAPAEEVVSRQAVMQAAPEVAAIQELQEQLELAQQQVVLVEMVVLERQVLQELQVQLETQQFQQGRAELEILA